MKNHKEWYKKILEALFKFTTLFKASRTSIQSLQNIGHADYKKLKGSGIDTMPYKFMVSQSHGVITAETVTDDALIVHLGTLNNHH